MLPLYVRCFITISAQGELAKRNPLFGDDGAHRPSRHIYRRHRPGRPWREVRLVRAYHGERDDGDNEDGETAHSNKTRPELMAAL
jgi:hypothetical protein